MFPNAGGKQKRLTSYFRRGESQQQPTASKEGGAFSRNKRPLPLSSSGGSFRSKNGGSGFGVCPLCKRSFGWHILESHASECQGISTGAGRDERIENTALETSPRASGNDATRIPMTTTKRGEHGGITPLDDTNQPESPTTSFTKAITPSSSSSSTTRSNIVTPRLAPIFQTKPRNDNTNGSKAPPDHSELRPHSYEPIPGLFVYEDFITKEEEALIVKGCIDAGRDVLPNWKDCRFQGKQFGKRWGVHCNLRDRRVDAPQHPLPDVLEEIVFPKLKRLNLPMVPAVKTFCPNEANAIDYRRSQGHWLKGHVDDRKLSKEPIANLSLVGDCYMTFKNVARHRNLAVPEQRVLLRRRCLQVLTGRARYDFSHGIANADLLSDRRVSITMRESPLTAASKSHSAATANPRSAFGR